MPIRQQQIQEIYGVNGSIIDIFDADARYLPASSKINLYFVSQSYKRKKRGARFARLSSYRSYGSQLAGCCLCVSYSAGCATAFRFSAALIESRIGRMTNKASATTITFMIEATTKTECQLPV